MEKVIVVTVHNSENCGSYLQAYAMQKVLQKLGYEVAFLYRAPNGTSHDKRRTIRLVWNLIKHLHILDAISRIRQWYTYESMQSKFKICKSNDNFCNEANHVILGSDTIWNFEEEYFRKTAKRLLGKTLTGKHIISYAASVGNTTADIFRDVTKKLGGLNHISTILVRDSHSQNVIRETCQKESSLVCDPTLLLQPEDFVEISTNQHINQPYLLLYYFGIIPEDIQKVIQQYAYRHQMRIVSLLTKRDWCDYFILSSPGNMVACYAGASAVVTNTFHGCALSLIYQVPFAAHDEGKVKVKELLNTYDSSDRLFIDTNNLPIILERKLNNKALVNTLTMQSLEKLKQALQ